MESRSTTQTTQGTTTRAYLILVGGVVAVSLAAILIRLAQQEGVPSALIACGRLLVATLVLTPAILRNVTYRQQIQSLTRRDLGLILLAGGFLAAHFLSWVTSLEYTTVLISVVLVTTTPIWVALMEVFILRARLSRLIIIGLVIALAGGLLIGLSGEVSETAPASDRWFGAFLSVIGAITVAAYLIIGRKFRAQIALAPYIWLVYGTAALIVLAILVFSSTPLTGYALIGYVWVIATGLVPQLIGHSALNYALAYLPATYVSLATQMEPILSAFVAALIFAEIPGPLQIIGGAVILGGVILASLGQSGND